VFLHEKKFSTGVLKLHSSDGISLPDDVSSHDLRDHSFIKVDSEDEDEMSGFSEGQPRVVLLDQQSTHTINSRYLKLDEQEKNSSQLLPDFEGDVSLVPEPWIHVPNYN
jgi:hypothetical protein